MNITMLLKWQKNQYSFRCPHIRARTWSTFYTEQGLCIFRQNQTSKATPLPLPTNQPTAAARLSFEGGRREERREERHTLRVESSQKQNCSLSAPPLFPVGGGKPPPTHFKPSLAELWDIVFGHSKHNFQRGLLWGELKGSNILGKRRCKAPGWS